METQQLSVSPKGTTDGMTKDSEGGKPRDSGDVIAQELMLFEHPDSDIPLMTLLKLSGRMLCECLALNAVTMPSTAMNNLANVLLNRNNTAADQAAMGIALAYNLWFYYSLILSMPTK